MKHILNLIQHYPKLAHRKMGSGIIQSRMKKSPAIAGRNRIPAVEVSNRNVGSNQSG